MTDYLNIPDTQITRPVCGVYELSNVITKLAKNIYDTKNLSKYIKSNGVINNFINPAAVATELFKNGIYDARLKRDKELINFSDLYVNPKYYELLNDYFNNQQNNINKFILDNLVEQ